MKELKVIKRDGRIVDFDKSKIVIAIMKAFKSADQKLMEEDENFKPDKDYELIKANNIAEYIKNYVESIDYNIDIETIQDMVEKGLMSNKRKDVAKAYILYREERSKIRAQKIPKSKYSIGDEVVYNSTSIPNECRKVSGVIYDFTNNKYLYTLKDIIYLFKEDDLVKLEDSYHALH